MKDFNEYEFATISEKENSEIKNLENKIKSESGKDVVLIAYEKKES